MQNYAKVQQFLDRNDFDSKETQLYQIFIKQKFWIVSEWVKNVSKLSIKWIHNQEMFVVHNRSIYWNFERGHYFRHGNTELSMIDITNTFHTRTSRKNARIKTRQIYSVKWRCVLVFYRRRKKIIPSSWLRSTDRAA